MPATPADLELAGSKGATRLYASKDMRWKGLESVARQAEEARLKTTAHEAAQAAHVAQRQAPNLGLRLEP